LTTIPAVLSDNEAVINHKAKAELLNNYFANICNVDETNIPEVPDFAANVELLSDIDITMQEVHDQLNQIGARF
jgi:hypothetical protein